MPPRPKQPTADNSINNGLPFRRKATYLRRSASGWPTHLVGNEGVIALHANSRPLTNRLATPASNHHSNNEYQNPKANAHDNTTRPVAKHYARPPKSATRPTAKPALARQMHSQVLERSAFGPKAIKMARPTPRRPYRVHVPLPALLAAVLFIVAAGAFSFTAWRANRSMKAPVAVLSSTTNREVNGNNLPDETEPDRNSFTSYQVSPGLPRFLRIPKISLSARVTRLGATGNNGLGLPANIFDAGWYEGSAKPGEKGALLLGGYIAGPTQRGAFYSLGSLKAGDKLEIERGDGKIFHYQVAKAQLYDYDKVDMAAAMVSVQPGKPGLNLITYSGRFDVRTNKFESRLVVFAVQQD